LKTTQFQQYQNLGTIRNRLASIRDTDGSESSYEKFSTKTKYILGTFQIHRRLPKKFNELNRISCLVVWASVSAGFEGAEHNNGGWRSVVENERWRMRTEDEDMTLLASRGSEDRITVGSCSIRPVRDTTAISLVVSSNRWQQYGGMGTKGNGRQYHRGNKRE